MELEIIRTLYAYNDWANRQLLGTATLIAAIDYKRDFGQAWGSIHNTFAHLLSVDMLWFSRWKGHSPLAMPNTDEYSSLGLLRSRWESLMDERRTYINTLTSEDLSKKIEYRSTNGTPRSETLWHVMLHVVNHGTDHRSHLALMMTELGHPPPALDLIYYLRDHS
jgi:uncharacterized damage-inducible protein DinB